MPYRISTPLSGRHEATAPRHVTVLNQLDADVELAKGVDDMLVTGAVERTNHHTIQRLAKGLGSRGDDLFDGPANVEGDFLEDVTTVGQLVHVEVAGLMHAARTAHSDRADGFGARSDRRRSAFDGIDG